MAIAIPTFFGATSSARHRAAQSDLRNALNAAQVVYTDQGQYPTTNGTSIMQSSEPSLQFLTTSSTPKANSNQVGVDIVTSGAIVIAAQSVNGVCWFLANAETATDAAALGVPAITSAGAWYGVGQTSPTSTNLCTAANYNSTASGWVVAPGSWQQQGFPSPPPGS